MAEMNKDNKNGKPPKKDPWRNMLIWGGAVLCLMLIIGGQGAENYETAGSTIPFSDFMSKADAGEFKRVKVTEGMLIGESAAGPKVSTYTPPTSAAIIAELRQKDVTVYTSPKDTLGSTLFSIFVSWFPMIVLIGVWIFFIRQMHSGNNKALSFGKSKARMQGENMAKVTFADVAGIDEARQELEEVVDFLKDPTKFNRLGGRIPKGVLLVGPPGTGKTLLARAIAGEANAPFFSISGSDFVEMFVGVGASRVRDMFEQGKKNAPCIIFIDEIDAVGRHRGAGLGGGNDEREQTLNQLLVEMDGFEANSGVILIAATNRPDVLDPALLRPGRFDRQVVVSLPDIGGREKILEVHMKKVPLATGVSAKTLARGTPGFSGADLANMVNEAALIAARRNRKMVTQEDLEYAKDKVMMGAERKSMVIPPDERKNTAYHEAGHAICAMADEVNDPIHKATIIPRGRAYGMVMQLPENDNRSYTKDKLLAKIVVCFGGRIAEELTMGPDKVSTGAQQDIRVATSLARRMITEWGMSDAMGTIAYEEPEEEVFLGHTVTKRRNMSEATSEKVDAEIKATVDACYAKAKKILTERRGDLDILAEGLLEFETLSGDEIKDLLSGKKPTREDPNVPAASSSIEV